MQESIVAKNPLDLGIPSTLKNAADVCEIVPRDPNVDMLAWAAMPRQQQTPGTTSRRSRTCSQARKAGASVSAA